MIGSVDLSPAHRAIVERILKKHVQQCEVRAFGSRVAWTAKDSSDLDLAVVDEGPLPWQVLSRLKEAFEDSPLPMRVDVLDWHAISQSFREVIERSYLVVQKGAQTRNKMLTDRWIETDYGIFRRDFKVDSLRDLCSSGGGIQTGPFGSQLHKSDYVPVGTPIITVEHLGENRIVHRDLPRVSDYDRNRLSKYILRQGDIVFSRVGSVDRRSLVREAEEGWLFSGRCLRVRPDVRKISPAYLSYYFGLPAFQEHIRSIAVGATMPSLNTQILSKVSIAYPTLSEQRAIAHILGTLDDKIELNRRMNQTLEEMARSLFKSWFVDFDQVRAKAALKQHDLGHDAVPDGEPSGNGAAPTAEWTVERARAYLDAMDPQIADLFPDRLVPSELGEIPEGWEVKALGEDFRITMGQSPPGRTYNQTGDGIPLYQGRTDFGFRFPGYRVYCNAPTRLGKPGDTLVSVRAPVGDVNMASEECCIGRGVAAVCHRSESKSYTYYSMRALRSRFELFEADGTVFGAVNKAAFKSMPWVSSPDQLIVRFEALCASLDSRIETNELAIASLTAQCRALLPKLIAGEISVG